MVKELLYLWVWLARAIGSVAGKCDDTEVTGLETCKLSLQAKMKPENKPLIWFLNIVQGTGILFCSSLDLKMNLLEDKHKGLLPSLQGGCKALPECLDEIKYVVCYCINFLISCSSGHCGFGVSVHAWLLCSLSSNLSPALPQAFLCWGSMTKPTHVDMVWARCHAHGVAWHASHAPVCRVPVSMQLHLVSSSWASNLCFPPPITVLKPAGSGLFWACRHKEQCMGLWTSYSGAPYRNSAAKNCDSLM